VVAGFLALGVPRVTGLLARIAEGAAPPPVTLNDVLWSMALVPVTAWCLRHLPPLRWFQEHAE
jgi:hypothetical protein